MRSSGESPARDAVLTETPGIQYLVTGPHGIVHQYAAGWADLGSRSPMTVATTMMGYSMSKTITAAAVMRLVQDGTIALDGPITEYVGSLPYDPRITIRQLLSHTSGLPNPIPLRWVHSATSHQHFDERAALNSVIAKHPRQSFRPGRRFSYSNIGYWLLGRMVESVTQRPFTSFVTDHVLQPIGASPDELGYAVADPARHATGYLERYSVMNLARRFLIAPEFVGAYAGRWLEIKSHYLNGPAFGGLVGTARGFGAFLRDQLSSRSAILDDATRAMLCEPQRTMNGALVPMTLGWHVGDREGRRFFYKEGGGGGFHCLMRLYPNDRIGSVVMTNATRFGVDAYLDTADRRFLA